MNHSAHDGHSMKAWGKSLDESKSSGLRFLGDPAGEFTRAWDVEFDAAKLLGNNRSKRYAVSTEDGKVVNVAVEPDDTGVSSKFTASSTNVRHALTTNSLRRRQVLVNQDMYFTSPESRPRDRTLHEQQATMQKQIA